MKIKREIYQKLIYDMPEKPPEIGGIIGGKNDIVTHFYIDRGVSDSHSAKCNYSPNTAWLNLCIQEWENDDIEFYGIFHCHFGGASTLSKGDICYIRKIMEKMPERVTKLYFPVVVLPIREMILYYCTNKKGGFVLKQEDITIL